MNWQTIGCVITLCLALGCEAQRAPSSTAPTTSARGSTIPGTASDAWTAPNLLYFSAFEREALGISVDDRYVYWYQDERTFMRGLKSGSSAPEVLTRCGTCNLFRFVADSDTRAVYFLARQEVIRVDRETGASTSIPLDWDHDLGGIAVDTQFVYTAMPGCAAITRINKRTLSKEVMRVPDVAFPNRAGVTQLAFSGNAIVCASPSDLFVIDEWQAPPRRVVHDIGSVWGVVALEDHVFWLESDRSPNTIGQVPLAGGEVSRVPQLGRTPQTMKLVNLQIDQQLVFGTGDGLQSFDRVANQFGRLAKVGYVLDLAADSDAVYATIWGKRSHVVGGTARIDDAYWVVKVPAAELR